MRLLAKALLLHASVAFSSPVLEERALSPGACSKVEAIVALLKLNRATPFCSSYLSIPAATTTVLKPVGTVTVTTGTTTVTSTSNPTVTATAFVTIPQTQVITTNDVITSTTVSTSTATVVATLTSSIYVQGAPAPARRDLAHERDGQEHAAPAPRAASTAPSWLKPFASAAISSGCLCLSIPTKTNTVTQGAPTTVQTKATAILFVVNTVTLTQTNTVAQYNTVTVTAQPVTTTITSVSITTTTTTQSTYTATATADPCQPPGLSFASGNTGGGRYGGRVNVNSGQQCCNACFYGSAKDCIGFEYDGSYYCTLTLSNVGEVNPALANAQCPMGQRENTRVGYRSNDFARYNIGPCLGILRIIA
ncbi:hypothetical protein DE146DRAFT_740351 [Phaeosphaeria sp. MPI-PUGE-AT-0046c]|nr:hypothetical protein DE146DRAFT_740351 [Phaeosphaeria sp. MPI-PUGE-AT-0046c]